MEIPSSCESVFHVANSRKDSRLPVNFKERQLIDDLEDSFRKILRVQDIQETECKRKETCGDGFEQPKPRDYDKCLSKCDTFCSGVTVLVDKKVHSEEDSRHPSEITVQEPLARRSMSLPLASAMKGSRALRDAAPIKLTVKWAPDVYDPPQTLLSHTVKNKKQIQHKSKIKKNGRKVQKGNLVRGGSSKDKKKVRRDKGTSTRGRLIDAYGEMVGFVGSPDCYCGSNFLINSVTKVHYSVAEAL